MSKSTTRRPLELPVAAADILRKKLGPDFTKEMLLSYDVDKLAEFLDCDSMRFEQILWWADHPGYYDYRDRALSEEELEWTTLTAEHTLRPIGLFIIGFSSIEYALRMILQETIKLPAKFAESVITHDFSLLCTAVLEVHRQTEDAETYAQLKKLISRVREFNDLRVKVVHGAWVPGDDGGLLVHTSRSSLQNFYTNGMAEHLEEQALLMREVQHELLDFMLRDEPEREESENGAD